jgi:hypothetical protein
MSKEKLRIDKTCLNCRHVVDRRYCPNCGQENTISTKSFHHLFIHFFEDLTHYDNAFWKTILNLFFKPAALTKAYLAGQRLTYLAPFRLYIFISFITFLLISIFPNEATQKETEVKPIVMRDAIIIPSLDSLHIEDKGMNSLAKVGLLSQNSSDTIKKMISETKEENDVKKLADFGYKSIKQLDSAQRNKATDQKLSAPKYWFLKKWLTVKEQNTDEEIFEKFGESFYHNLPKVLFLYMPVFAFILWLFHDKKRWYYFDNGIFTLHYFSFLLLIILALFFINKFFNSLEENSILNWLHFSIKSIGIFWMLYYFFPAHRRFYEERKTVAFLQSSAILFINIIIISVLTVLFALYTYINIH